MKIKNCGAREQGEGRADRGERIERIEEGIVVKNRNVPFFWAKQALRLQGRMAMRRLRGRIAKQALQLQGRIAKQALQLRGRIAKQALRLRGRIAKQALRLRAAWQCGGWAQWRMAIRPLLFAFVIGTLPFGRQASLVSNAYANNVALSNVALANLDTGAGTVDVQFDISQSNAFRLSFNGKEFYDSIWLFVKFSTAGANGPWRHAHLVSGGNISPESDNKGAFLVPQATEGQTASWSDTAKTLRWDFANAGNEGGALTGTESVRVKVFALEMVKVPTDSFYYNYGNQGSTYTFNQYVEGETTPVLVDGTGDIPSGAAAGWPNGYSSFYLGKYEVSQGQYVDFLNTLPGFWNNTGAANTRFTNNNGDYEHGIYHDGTKYNVGSSTADRASNYLNWDDMRTYLSWSALRPMTEMEFEKAARGGGNQRNYPWGNTAPSTDNSLYTPSGHSALYDAWKYYVNFTDGGNNVQGQDGPTAVGLYLSGDIDRDNNQKGVSPYGIADLAGNVWGHLINCAFASVPDHGNGNASFSDENWPEASSGKGLRGASWNADTPVLRVSVRGLAGWANTARDGSVGFRPARTP